MTAKLKYCIKRVCFLIVFLMFGWSLTAQPIYWNEGRYYSANCSYSHKMLNMEQFDVFGVEFSTYPSPTMGWEMASSIEFGKDYFSFEPISLVGSLFVFVTQFGDFDAKFRFAAMLLAVTAGKVPIYPLNWMEIVPYWNLMKCTMIKSKFSNMQIYGDIGLSLRFFPLESFLDWYDTFFISPFAEYDFGYEKNSPFKGFGFGVKVGMFF